MALNEFMPIRLCMINKVTGLHYRTYLASRNGIPEHNIMSLLSNEVLMATTQDYIPVHTH